MLDARATRARRPRSAPLAGASHQEAGDERHSVSRPPFGGMAVGTRRPDRFPSSPRNTTIGGEVSSAGAISGDQSQRAASATNAFTSRHRDTVFSGIFEIGTPLDGPIHAAFARRRARLPPNRARRHDGAACSRHRSGRRTHAVVSDFVAAISLGGDVDLRDHQPHPYPRARALAPPERRRPRRERRGEARRVVDDFRSGAGAAWRF